MHVDIKIKKDIIFSKVLFCIKAVVQYYLLKIWIKINVYAISKNRMIVYCKIILLQNNIIIPITVGINLDYKSEIWVIIGYSPIIR